MGFFAQKKSLEELQEEDEGLTTDVSIAKKRALIRELEAREGTGSWKMFSENGKRSGVDFRKIWAWLRAH